MKRRTFRILICFSILCILLITTYCISVAIMYYSIGDTDHVSTLNPLGTTSVIHFMKAQIYGRDLDGCKITIYYPMMPLFEFKSHSQLAEKVKSILSQSTTVHVNHVDNSNKDKIAYLNETPEYRKIYIIIWLFIGIYILIHGLIFIFKIYRKYLPLENQYVNINDNNLGNNENT